MTTVSQSDDTPAATELEATPPEVKRYQRQKITVRLINLLLSLTVLILLAAAIGPQLRSWLPDWISSCDWLTLIATAVLMGVVLEAVSVPLDFYSGFVLEHRHGLSTQTLGKWISKLVKGYLIGGLLGLPMLLGLYALIWYTGAWWWAWAVVGWLALTLVLGRIAPVLILPLFYKVTPLEDDVLKERLQRLAEGTGLHIQGVYRLHLSEETKKANAALTGLGRSRRVLLGDTLLEQFTPEEIEVVFAHEVGHHVFRHLPRMIVWSTVVAAVGFWLVNLVLHVAAQNLGYSRFDDPTALPLVLLVLTGFGLLLTPVQNFISRIYERQCDRYALQRTGFRTAYRSAFTKLARLNKSDPDPNPLIVWFLYDHPPIRERLALADVVTE